MDRRFRFGVVAAPMHTGEQWRALARRTEELGYSTLLMPDGLHLLAPLPAAAMAAAVTTTLRVGTFVLASTVRRPRTAAWEANSLTTLTDNRFELGIGGGSPWMNKAVVDEIGLPETTPAQRLALIRRTVEALRAVETKARTPVMIAAGGPRSRALAGEIADIVTVAHGPLATRQEVKRMITEIGSDDIEYSMNVLVVGDSVPAALAPLVGADVNALVEADSLHLLRGTPQRMADEIQRRRDTLGYSYVTVNAAYLDVFAPVVELLQGR